MLIFIHSSCCVLNFLTTCISMFVIAACMTQKLGRPVLVFFFCPFAVLWCASIAKVPRTCINLKKPPPSSYSGRIRFDSCSLYPQNEIGPSISSSVVLHAFVLLVYIVSLVLVLYLCPSSVCVVATFPGTVLFPLLCSVLPFFPL